MDNFPLRHATPEDRLVFAMTFERLFREAVYVDIPGFELRQRPQGRDEHMYRLRRLAVEGRKLLHLVGEEAS